jgi:hypothetical protein
MHKVIIKLTYVISTHMSECKNFRTITINGIDIFSNIGIGICRNPNFGRLIEAKLKIN